GNLELELLFDLGGDEPGKALGEGDGRAEDDVAALDVGLDVAAAGFAEHGGEVLHRKAVLAAHVDPSEERGELVFRLRLSRHAPQYSRKRRGRRTGLHPIARAPASLQREERKRHGAERRTRPTARSPPEAARAPSVLPARSAPARRRSARR